MTARGPGPGSPVTPSESDERYRTLFDHAPDAIVVLDMETGKFVDANANACLLFGLSLPALLELGLADVSPELQGDGTPSAERAHGYLTCALNGEIPNFEWTHCNADGELIACEVRLVRLPPANRQLVRGSMTDIRDRKRTEAEIARSERDFRTLSENSPDWIIRVDRDLRRTYANPAVLEASGASLSDLLGKRPTESFPGVQEMIDWETALTLAIETGEPQQFERKTALGRERYLQTSIVPERAVSGEIVGALSITRDVTSVRRADEAEMRLADIVGSATDAILSTGLDGAILTWNKGAELVFGYTADEVIGRTTEFLFTDAGNDDRDEIRYRLQAGESIGGDVRDWRRKDKSVVTISAVMFPLRDATGQTVGTASIARDISQELATARALALSEERLRQVLGEAGMGDWSQDPANGTLRFSEESARIYRRPLSEMPTTLPDALALFHPDDLPRVREWAKQPDAMPNLRREYRIRMPDGSFRWIAGIGQVQQPDGRLVSGLIMDINDQKTAEIALRESEARFRSVVDNSPDFITRMDRDLRHEFVNRTAERDAGLVPEFVLGKRSDELGFLPEQAALFIARQQQALESGEIVEYEYPINSLLTPDRVSYRRARIVPEKSDDGTVHHLLSIVTDITAEREAAQERALIAERMRQAQQLESLGVLAAGIAHDFNNLLVAMLGNAGLALMEIPEDSPARQTIHEIEAAAERAAELTRQMLAYSGKGRLSIGRVDLSAVVSELRPLLESTATRFATLDYELLEPLPMIEADAAQVRQVIVNLVTNASDALGDRDGTIAISTGVVGAPGDRASAVRVDGGPSESGFVFLKVTDSGSGMDAETQARIFDPFFTTKFAGRGLGLAAVHGIVHGHGGSISVDSTPGRGTTFTVLLPVAPGQMV